MSYYDDDSDAYEGYVTEDRAAELFIEGAQAMREMLARFVEQSGQEHDKIIAMSIRANWVPSWGEDPGKIEGDIPKSAWG